MAANYYTPADRVRRAQAAPAPIHPSWCDCYDCADDWDAAHRGDWRAIRAGLILGLIAAAILGLLILLPQPRAERGCDAVRANPSFAEIREGACR